MKRSDLLMLNRKCRNKNLITIIKFYMESYQKKDLYDAIISLAAELLVLGGVIKEQPIPNDESNAKPTTITYELFGKFSNDARPTSTENSSNVTESRF